MSRKIPPPKSYPIDSKAQHESMDMENERLKHQSHLDDHHRKEKFRQLLSRIITIFVLIISVVAFLGTVFWFWHLLTPYDLHFLSEKQLNTIATIIISSVVTTSIGRWFEKYM